MNVNQLKDNLRKRKTSVWYKNIIDGRLLTALKEKAPLYARGEGLINIQQNINNRIHPCYIVLKHDNGRL